MADRLRTICKLADCAYYQAVPGKPEECDCGHPDKRYYLRNPCPLYKKEWLTAQNDELKAKVLPKRRY